MRNNRRETPPLFSVDLLAKKRKSCVTQKKRDGKNWEKQQVRKA